MQQRNERVDDIPRLLEWLESQQPLIYSGSSRNSGNRELSGAPFKGSREVAYRLWSFFLAGAQHAFRALDRFPWCWVGQFLCV